ncbi:venom protease-like [Pollicipes pollicipes]|uniref:venom protease-like n=1 Tax=Pollicipes pollicipes TaxID=41117 RepID=UPI0018859381|nr:venom protease-like [Pollicipes pollicipes]
MKRWSCHGIVLFALLNTVTPIEFLHRSGRCSGEDQLCTPVVDCPGYKTRADILNKPPTPCGFSGRTPLICCESTEATSPKPVSLTQLLPEECGNPNRTISVFRFRRDTTAIEAHGSLREDTDFLGPGTIQQAVGGFNAILGKWPWMVLFGRRTDAGKQEWFCGGVLITDRHVLTAAHCLRPEQTATVVARIGEHDLTAFDDVIHQERNITSIVRHPQYHASQNDLAVVRLQSPVQLTDAVRPICLPPAGSQHHGQDVEMAGWGLVEFGGETADVLQEVPLRVVDEDACEDAYRQAPAFNITFPGGFQGTKICAGSRDDKPRDACRGDSGGPLMVQLPDGSYQLIGIVSTGVGCGNPKFPGIYTKVSSYIDWILGNLIK